MDVILSQVTSDTSVRCSFLSMLLFGVHCSNKVLAVVHCFQVALSSDSARARRRTRTPAARRPSALSVPSVLVVHRAKRHLPDSHAIAASLQPVRLRVRPLLAACCRTSGRTAKEKRGCIWQLPRFVDW